jgi:hypothetical protein
MVISSRLSIRIADFFFYEEDCPVDVDIRRFTQLSAPKDGLVCTPFSTIIIDVSQEPRVLLSKMKRDTRYDIRRATEREGFLYDYWSEPSAQVITEFADFYDQFAAQTNRLKLPRARFSDLARASVLDISRISSPEGEPLIWHSHYHAGDRARLLESASLYRKTADSTHRTYVGRANRYHHWRDMLRLKELGCTTYDFGGWYAGKEDVHKLRINAFKEEFGGTVVQNFNCLEAVTLKGKIAARMLSLRGR